MKSSRAMLLAAMLFAVPAFADQTTQTQETNTSAEQAAEVTKTEQPSWFAANFAVLTGLGTTVVNYTVAPIAKLTTIPMLNQFLRISYLKGGRFESSIPTVGKSMVAIAAVGVAYKAYQAMNPQDDSNDDEDIFGE